MRPSHRPRPPPALRAGRFGFSPSVCAEVTTKGVDRGDAQSPAVTSAQKCFIVPRMGVFYRIGSKIPSQTEFFAWSVAEARLHEGGENQFCHCCSIHRLSTRPSISLNRV